MILSFEVPGAPVPYQRPAQGKRGRYTESRTAGFMALVGFHARIAANAGQWTRPTMQKGVLRGPEGVFCLNVAFYREQARGDLDNLVKSVCDGLTKAAIWRDDALLVRLSAEMDVDRDNPRTVVVLMAGMTDGK